MRPIKVYYSGPIRGYPPNDDNIPKNIAKGREISKKLQKLFGDLVDIYSPHIHNDAIHILYVDGKVTVQDILETDLKIQNECDMIIADVSEPSEGVNLEINNALEHNQPIIKFDGNITEDVIEKILDTILFILRERTSKQCAWTI